MACDKKLNDDDDDDDEVNGPTQNEDFFYCILYNLLS